MATRNRPQPNATANAKTFAAVDALCGQGKFEDAEKLLFPVLEQDRRNLQALIGLAVIAVYTGRNDLAFQRFSEAIKLDPRNQFALVWAGRLLFSADRNQEAIPYLEAALKAEPSNVELFLYLGLSYSRLNLLNPAVDAFDQALRLHPNHPQVLGAKGVALASMFRLHEAVGVLEKSIAAQPDAYGLIKLAETYLMLHLIDKAVEAARRALELEPDNLEAIITNARVQMEADRSVEADRFWSMAETLAPDSGELFKLKGKSYVDRGEFSRAEPELRKSIDLQPNQGEAYRVLVTSKRLSETDRPLVELMESARASDELPPVERRLLLFSLGKAYDDLSDYELAAERFEEANRFYGKTFDPQAFSRDVDAKIRIFTRELMSTAGEEGSPSTKPTFVLGMMRSGTTLANQILSSHSQVESAGELSFWSEASGQVLDLKGERLKVVQAHRRANQYLAFLDEIAPDADRVIDKDPSNSMIAGLLAFVFPNCKIVHIRRRPIDIALSIWTTSMKTGASFVGGKDNIVFAIREYLRLADHWRSVIPARNYLEVNYEDLVSRSEAIIREMLDFCDLPWEDACLHPERKQDSIRTPSVWQARQPINSRSIERWRNYEPWLGSFAQLLDMD